MFAFANRTLVRRAVLLGVLVATPLALAGNAEAYQCKSSFTTVHSSGIAKAVAQLKARNNWTATVEDKFDLAWSVWNISANQQQSCSFGSGKWTCTAKAKPCLYVVP